MRSRSRVHRMPSVMASPVACLTALVTSSLVSRTATSASTGSFQAAMAARTWLRASAAAAGLGASRTRHACSSTARVSAIAFIGILFEPVEGPSGS